MNWEAIGAVGEVVGAIAVVATLVYLATQIRQNTKTVKNSSVEALIAAMQANINLTARDYLSTGLAGGRLYTQLGTRLANFSRYSIEYGHQYFISSME